MVAVKDTQRDITIGDLFWDKDHVWTDGSQDMNMVNLVLSRDKEEDGVEYWRVGAFSWCPAIGYCGAHDRFFTDADVLKMAKVGNITDIKGFV